MNNGEQFFNTAAGGGYAIQRSLRFSSADSSFLSRTPASAGNRKTFTFATWAKLTGPYDETDDYLLYAYGSGTSQLDYFDLRWQSNAGVLRVGGYSSAWRTTTAIFKDPSAWYHIVLAWDTTQATAANRVKLYVNGVEQTAFSSSSNPSLNDQTSVNNTVAHRIGNTSNLLLADCFLIDGQALDPSAFGEFSATTGVWVPKAYSGPAPTGNSFWLPFSDNSAATATTLGKDNFNLGNNWLPVNLSANAGSNTTNYSTLGTISRSGYVVGSPANAYDGSPADGALAVGTPWGAIDGTQSQTGLSLSFSSQVKIYYNVNLGGGSISVNGSSKSANVPSGGNTLIGTLTWTTSEISSPFSSLSFTSPNSGVGVYVHGVEIDGLMLIDYSARLREMDSLVDVPTNGSEVDTGLGGQVRGNYCTWNPLNTSVYTFTNGNLEATGYNGNSQMVSTIGVSSGKWYCEIVLTGSSGTSNAGIGISKGESNTYPGELSTSYGYFGGGVKINAGSVTSYGAAFVEGDVIGIALNMDAGTCTMYKNGASQGQLASGLTGTYFFAVRNAAGDAVVANFGQRSWAYQAPAGFKSLNTASLPAPVVTKPSTVFDVKLYTGNGSTQTISGLGFSPDLVWIKERSSTAWNALFDTIRGANKALYSNDTYQEETLTNTFQSFNSDGFSLSYNSAYSSVFTNRSSQTYAAWAWDAGTTTVTNTAGSITSTVRANPSAGFSVVTFTGNGSNPATVGHGLGAPLSLILFKRRDASVNWFVYHKAAGNGVFEGLNTTAAYSSAGGVFNQTAPSSTTFSLGNTDGNTNGATYVAYCFAPVNSYSSFGSYVGNGSADGPFVYTNGGFRPKWLMIKCTGAPPGDVSQWVIKDSARPNYNPTDGNLYANLSNQEDTAGSAHIDLLSNGFKVRGSYGGVNASGFTYVYCAFAELPFAANNRAR